MDTAKVLDLVSSLSPSSQARICKLILQEASASISEGGPCELWLEDKPTNVIGAIKVVRSITSMGLKEAKDVVDGAEATPQKVKNFDNKIEAAAAGGQLAAVGAIYSIREAK